MVVLMMMMMMYQLAGAAPNMRSLTLLLELLTVIPEEFQTLILSSTRRTAVRHTFAAGGAPKSQCGNVAIIKPTTPCSRPEPSSPLPPERHLSPQPAPGGQPRGRAAGEIIGSSSIFSFLMTLSRCAGVQVCQGLGPVRGSHGELRHYRGHAPQLRPGRGAAGEY